MSVIPNSMPSKSTFGWSLSAWVKMHPVTAIFILTYALSWLFLIPLALDSRSLLPFHIPALVALPAGWMPALAAILVAGWSQGRAGVRELFGRLGRWRVNPVWYLVALLAPAAFALAGMGLYSLLGGQVKSLFAPNVSPVQALVAFPIVLVEFMIFNTEEFAWRGIALPNLQSRYGALAASLILGVVHTLWHLPYFFTLNRPFYSEVGLPMFFAWTLALTLIFTWVFNNTRGSLLLAVLFHAANDAWSQLLNLSSVQIFYLAVAVMWVVALLLLVRFGPARLSRRPDAERAFVTGGA